MKLLISLVIASLVSAGAGASERIVLKGEAQPYSVLKPSAPDFELNGLKYGMTPLEVEAVLSKANYVKDDDGRLSAIKCDRLSSLSKIEIEPKDYINEQWWSLDENGWFTELRITFTSNLTGNGLVGARIDSENVAGNVANNKEQDLMLRELISKYGNPTGRSMDTNGGEIAWAWVESQLMPETFLKSGKPEKRFAGLSVYLSTRNGLVSSVKTRFEDTEALSLDQKYQLEQTSLVCSEAKRLEQ